jgi:large subunit ribosomal protein L33
MQESDKMREKIILICEVCLSRNYTTYKNKDKKERLQIKKYCKRCGEHTLHKESK